MKKEFWFFLFVVVFVTDLVAIQMNLDLVKFIFKPMIILSLIGYFISATRSISNKLKHLIILALIFSWMGDVLLMFESKHSLFFILGLSAFLLAHLFYIFFFHQVRIQRSIGGKVFLLIPTAIFYFVLMNVLEPYLGALKLPVRIYGVVICVMLVLALHMLYLKDKQAGKLFATGALLFVVSDTLLAINKFYISFSFAGLSIILTYGLAQFFIIKGSIFYFNSLEKK